MNSGGIAVKANVTTAQWHSVVRVRRALHGEVDELRIVRCGFARHVGHRREAAGVGERAVPFVERPRHGGSAVEADVDALQRRDPQQHVHVIELSHRHAVDDHGEIPSEVVDGGGPQRDVVRAGL